jgi:hypothetical protein
MRTVLPLVVSTSIPWPGSTRYVKSRGVYLTPMPYHHGKRTLRVATSYTGNELKPAFKAIDQADSFKSLEQALYVYHTLGSD